MDIVCNQFNLTGTSEDIDESENVFVIQFMEERVIQMAEEKKFFGVMTTNTNALTQVDNPFRLYSIKKTW